MSDALSDVPVVILCGGRGVVFGEGQAGRLNKALVPVNGKPLFWWVVLHYANHGALDFLLPVGLQGGRLQAVMRAECGAEPEPGDPHAFQVVIGGVRRRLRVIPTGVEDSTGARMSACREHLASAPVFALTYSDTLADVDLGAELAFHRSHGGTATLVSTQCPVRFRILGVRHGESLVRAFAPKPVIEAAAINGGFYLFTPAIWDSRYGLGAGVALENQPLESLAAERQLHAFEHRGAWQHCDAERDLALLERLARQLAAPSA